MEFTFPQLVFDELNQLKTANNPGNLIHLDR
ncbi:hypothetical protein QE422_001361 [Chryseobacterium sp. SORGH_AS 447]|nr:hypothetical protein [Chryseobacterium sp. SORGH_AS_0447]